MPALRAYFFRPKNTKKKTPVLQVNRRLAFCEEKEGSLKDFMVHVLTFVRQNSSHVANRKLKLSPSCRDIIVLMLKRKNFFLKFQLLCVHVLTFYSKKTEGKVGGGGGDRAPGPSPCYGPAGYLGY